MKKTEERVIKMMAGLSNQLSKAWHFPLCWNLVSFLTSRALSWPDGFPLCHLPPFPLIDYIYSVGPPYPGPVITDQIIVIIGFSEHHEACSVEVAVIVMVLSGLFITPYEKVRQNCSHSERKLSWEKTLESRWVKRFYFLFRGWWRHKPCDLSCNHLELKLIKEQNTGLIYYESKWTHSHLL